jgi:hypothetical protein
MRAKCLLQERLRLLPTVTAIILDYAEYWVRSVGWRNEPVVVDEKTVEQPYVQVRVSDLGCDVHRLSVKICRFVYQAGAARHLCAESYTGRVPMTKGSQWANSSLRVSLPRTDI